MQKQFYIVAHLHSRPQSTAVEFCSNLSAILTKSCAQCFPPIFGLFEIFDSNFAKLVGPTSNANQKHLVHLKEQLETKASSHEGQCKPAGSNVSPPRLVLLTMSITTMRSRLFPANSASVCLRFAKSRPQFCESCGATYTDLRNV